MAIPSIEKQLDESKVGFALVNNILEFNKGSAYPAKRADIQFMGETVTIYPHPDQSFYYNLKEWFSAIAGRFGYIDDLDIDIVSDGLIYDWTDRALLNSDIEITIYYQDNTSAVINNLAYLINGLIQVEDFKKRGFAKPVKNATFALTPFDYNSIESAYVRYWYGYPFDFTVHKSAASSSITVTNTQNTDEIELESSTAVNRIVVSDGRTDVGLVESLSLIEGNNLLLLSGTESPFSLVVDRKTKCNDGVYVKWINSSGGYSYWLFDKGDRNRLTKDLGDVQNDNYNLEDTVNVSLFVGKESNDEIKVSQLSVLPIQQPLFNDMIDAPAFWIFTGNRFDRNNFNDWVGIKLKTSSVRTEKAKNSTNNYELVFELPQRNTRTL